MSEMKRSNSEQLLDGLKAATLGPNQRTSGQADDVGQKKRVSKDPQQRPLLGLLSNIAGLSVIVAVFIVSFSETQTSELPKLLVDVVTFQRVPWTAQDNVAAVVAGLVSLLPLVLVDYTICAALCKDAGGRWFLLHALGNLVVAIMSLPDIYYWFKNPPGAMSVGYCKTLPFPGCSDWPTCLIIAMHVYHMISFKLSGDDLFHHLLFVPLIGGVNFVYPWGVSGNILSFFISGLPGGIDYLMLAAVKSGVLDSYVEKRINCSINTWVRSPGITAFIIIVTGSWLKPVEGTDPADLMPAWLFFASCAVIFFNGQFYAQRVIGNYYIRKAQDYQKRGIKYVDLHAS